MTHQNTHRAVGRAITPLTATRRAAHVFGGSAVLGTVLVGTAFAGGTAAMANDEALAGSDEGPTTSQSAPAESAPASTGTKASATNSSDKLRQGDSGQSVEALQASLNEHGANLPETGYFGSMTADAVIDFQAENGLQTDAVVGPDTHSALGGGSTESASAESASTASTQADPAGVPTGGASAIPASTSSASGSSIMDSARSAVGTPYSWGGASLSGMDCSGLVTYAYQAAGIDLPRTSGEIAAQGQSISQSEAQPGDIVVYPGHVALYAGDGQIIDASGSKQQVVERAIWGNPTGFVSYR